MIRAPLRYLADLLTGRRPEPAVVSAPEPTPEPTPEPEPHVCPSGFGDIPRDEVEAALEFAEAQLIADDSTEGWLHGGMGKDPSRAADGADFEERKSQKRVDDAERTRTWSIARARGAVYRRLRRRRDPRTLP